MKHIFLIDPIENLNIKKDSSLMMATTFQHEGGEVYLAFLKDLAIANDSSLSIRVFPFKGEFKEDGCYLKSLTLEAGKLVEMQKGDIFHMRLDPPVDQKYVRTLWLLDYIEGLGVKVVNGPRGILQTNEKIAAYALRDKRVDSFVGNSPELFDQFVQRQKLKGAEFLVLKPLDLFGGQGVEKVHCDQAASVFARKLQELNGFVIAQPFQKEVLTGEYRAIYFKGEELGSIIKKPVEGSFISNIAQGSSFEKVELPSDLKKLCHQLAIELGQLGIDLIAFDLLENAVTEINVTCPGLIVEVSYAHQKNLAREIYLKL